MKKIDIEEVLAEINKARKALKMRPLKKIPKGHKEDGYSCPIARGLGNRNQSDELHVSCMVETLPERGKKIAKAWGQQLVRSNPPRSPERVWVEMPMAVDRFVRDFDDGKFPEYEK